MTTCHSAVVQSLQSVRRLNDTSLVQFHQRHLHRWHLSDDNEWPPPCARLLLSIRPFINTHNAAVIIGYTQYRTTENIQIKHKSSNKSSRLTNRSYNQWMNWPYGRSHGQNQRFTTQLESMEGSQCESIGI